MELLQPYMNWIYLGAVVLAVFIFAWLMIRALGGRVRAKRGSRLGISEYYEVDKSRFLVLVRRDDVEHLVLVGGSQDVVIEAGISTRPARQGAPAGAKRSRNLAAEAIDSIPPAAPAGPAQEAPPLGPAEPAGNVRPLGSRPAPRPPVFADTAPADRPPNLRAVEHDLDQK
ncbi:flagellar biosynthetic protein FliO [Anderseniella sp. Alg231-50]|uniref:flagellar biosynthetic protein FliO n=1 Tax=Anderseniella sp. Alg231-50 TaxID=1922226 RepID=UPI000D54E423